MVWLLTGQCSMVWPQHSMWDHSFLTGCLSCIQLYCAFQCWRSNPRPYTRQTSSPPVISPLQYLCLSQGCVKLYQLAFICSCSSGKPQIYDPSALASQVARLQQTCATIAGFISVFWLLKTNWLFYRFLRWMPKHEIAGFCVVFCITECAHQ